jgi:endo-1,4-beta-D-glucanase Y
MKLRFATLPILGLSLLAACSDQRSASDDVGSVQQKVVIDPPSVGAVDSGIYRNLFVEWLGVSQVDVDAKLDALWDHYFLGGATAKLYYDDGSNANGPKAYIYDTGNKDVRSEGMGYGMMITVQLDRKAEFDALWNWAKSNMQYQSGEWAGYFAWQADRRGNIKGNTPASDGEEYFATALLFAAARWPGGTGIYDYEIEANAILDAMLHKEDMNGGVVNGVTNMFDATEKQVVFVPYFSSAEHTDPSYHLPAFYEIWARCAAGYSSQAADRQFWADAATVSRGFFTLATDDYNTGLSPDYAYFNGDPHPDYNGDPYHEDFRFDAWRVGMNWAFDYHWWAADDSVKGLSDTLLSFFHGQGISSYGNQYTLDGTELDSTHSLGLVSTNAAAALAATSDPSVHADEFVQELWNTTPQYGNYRYYDGLLQYMAFLHVSGNFRAYLPTSCTPAEICDDAVDNDGDGDIDCADADCSSDPACDFCGNASCGSAEDSCTCAADCGAAPSQEQSCSDGLDDDCDLDVDCADSDCAGDAACQVCGDASCGAGEDQCSCAADCGAPPSAETSCTDGISDDCDADVDCDDADCASDPACQAPTCGGNKAACSSPDDCCSGNCRNGSCKGG